MSELQAENITFEENDIDTEQADMPSESAPETGDNQNEKITFTEEQQKIFDEAISKKVFKAKEAQREAEKLRKELEETRAKLPREERPHVPPVPDRYEFDDDQEYQKAMRERDDAIMKAAAFDAKQEISKQTSEAEAKKAQAEQEKAVQELVKGYQTKAVQFGISETELKSINDTINAFGMSVDLGDHIMADEQGPLIAQYLAKNLTELDMVNSMTPLQAAIYIEKAVKPKAVNLKPRVTSAPEPVEHLNGMGVPASGGPKGATFE